MKTITSELAIVSFQCTFYFITGPVIELEELDDLYPDTEEDSGTDESVLLTSDEMGSSDWASMLVPGQTEGSGKLIICSVTM